VHWVHRWWTMAGSHVPPWTGGGMAGRRKVEHGDLIAGLTGARSAMWWLGDGVEMAAELKLNGGGARALGEGGNERGRCGESWQGRPLL
jgi:hypothetical protein